MRLDIKVIAGAKKNLVKKTEGGVLIVYLAAPANNGKANKALVDLLAENFKIAQSQISIIKGLKSRHKTINISEAKT